jgi:glycosyltransferase involved in cell wall biosynthesis
MWGRKTVALILPTSSNSLLFDVIEEFDSTGFIDEIIVVGGDIGVENESKIAESRAKFIRINKFNQGIALSTGIKDTKADLIIIAETNGAFKGKDVPKLLAYSDDFDMVFCSRTHVPLLEKKSNMTFPRRIVNVLFGKLINLLFLSSRLTDVACTLRLTSRNGWKKISEECKVDNEMFIVDWLLSAVKNKVRFIEIPVNFKTPKGQSTYAESYLSLAGQALLIFLKIWKVWVAFIQSPKFRKKA